MSWLWHLSIARSSFTNFTPSMEAKRDIMFRWYLLVCRQKQSYATEIYGQRYNTCALKEIFTLTRNIMSIFASMDGVKLVKELRAILKCSINKYVWYIIAQTG
jgi:hypothetical protein